MATNQMVRDAIEARNPPAALRMARQLKHPLKLADAAKLLQLLATDEMADQALFERSAVRWIQRLIAESRTVEWGNLVLAVKSVDEVDVDPTALPTPIEISFRPHIYPPDLDSDSD